MCQGIPTETTEDDNFTLENLNSSTGIKEDIKEWNSKLKSPDETTKNRTREKVELTW